MGARYPEGRSGSVNASVITGSGVQALLGGFDSQIKAGQQILAEALQDVMALAMEMDEKLFSGEKSTQMTYNGAPYVLKYSPEKDIKSDYSVNVRYGLMSGLDPSRALIFSLQALQANLISQEFVMQELPWNVNVSKEIERIDIEKMRNSLMGALSATSTAIPQMAAQGQDPSEIVIKIAQTIENRRSGKSVEDSVMDAFKKPEPEPAPPAPPAPEIPGIPQAAPGEGLPVAAQGPDTMGGAPVEVSPGATPPPNIQEILARLGG